MNHFFSFSFDKAIEAALRTLSRDTVKALLKHEEPERKFQDLLKSKPKHLRWSSHLRLKILHRQFSQRTVPGLPVIVRGARFIYTHLRHLKRALPDNA